MTASRAAEVAKRAPGRRVAVTMAGALAARATARAQAVRDANTDMRPEWARYAHDPVGFARNILGLELTPEQRAIVEAVRDNDRVAVRSGRRTGKSISCAVIALWFYCSFPAARVTITASTDRQVNGIIWRDTKRIIHRAPVRIPGADNVGELARTGIKSPDFSEIVGFTAKEGVAIQGIAGTHMLFIVDEASGVADGIFDAIEGNRASKGKMKAVLVGNPNRCDGEFFEAFHRKSQYYKTLHVSSRAVSAYGIDGLADAGWIADRETEYGKDSAFYRVHVEGEFPVNEEKKAIALALIEAAQERWHDTPAEGRLYIGLDPAGPGTEGDETAFAIRRGAKVMRVVAFTGLTPEGILANLLGFIKEHQSAADVRRGLAPMVVLDKQGEQGAKVLGALREHLTRNRHDFELAPIQSSDAAWRQPAIYDRIRDELWANLAAWLRDGGAIPHDERLERDLHAPEFFTDRRGKLKATDKRTLAKLLGGRSPDRGDAVTLACWEPLSARVQEQPPAEHGAAMQAANPYDALNAWRAGA